MHIGIDGRFVQGRATTGVTTYLEHLLKGLSQADQRNAYTVFLSKKEYNGRIPQKENFRLCVNSSAPLVWKNVWLPFKIESEKIDLMHFPAYTSALVNRKPNLVTVHDVIHKVNPRWFSRKELFLIDLPIQMAIQNATRIIAVSENTKRDIMRFYNIGSEKIDVTLEAADEAFVPMGSPEQLGAIRSKYGLEEEFILYVGVLFKRRNVERLLEAFALLKRHRDITHKLVIAGPGKPYFNLDEYLHKYGVEKGVSYLGYVPAQDLPLLYNAASFFVYPSLYEGFGLPVLEAMSCGKAVITSCVSSLPEIVGDAGILIDPYNTEELYDAMYRLVSESRLRNTLAQKAFERAKLFSWDKMAQQTIGIYEKMLATEKQRAIVHFVNEGERIKVEDRPAIYEVREPKELALKVDFGFARYDIILGLADKYFRVKNLSHLDLGSGLGYLMAKMAQRHFKTSGLDISRSFLDIAAEKLKFWGLAYEALIEADLEKDLGLAENSFDLITATDVLEHLQRPDLLLDSVYKLLKPQGKVIICTNNSLSIWGIQKFIRERIFFKKCFHPIDYWSDIFRLKILARQHGLEVLEARGTYFLPWARLKRFFSFLGLYPRRYELNLWLSQSALRYFGRDIILVLGKEPLKVRHAWDKRNNFSFFSFFRDPFTGLRRRHTLRRLLNLFLVRAQLSWRTLRAFGLPTYLVIEPTNICNLKCPLCPTGQGREGRSKGMMAWENFKKIIDELGAYLYSLRLENWGEPLLNDDIFKMVAYAKSKGIATAFNTNLCVLDEESAQRLVLCGLDHIKISLDGTKPDSYAQYRVGGDFNQVVENIRLLLKIRSRLKKKNPFIEVQFVVMRHNEDEIEGIKQLCRSLGVDGLFLERVRLDMREELLKPDSYCLEKFKDWLPQDDKYSLFDCQAKSRKNLPSICSWLWTSSVINWDGSINPCCGFYDTKYDFGNVFKAGFKQVWNGQKYREARRLIGRRKIKDKDSACMRCFRWGIVA